MFYYRYEDPDKGVVCIAEPNPMFVRKQRNGVIVRYGTITLADGVLNQNGSEIYRLKGKTALSEEYREIEPITMAEYETWLYRQDPIPEPDPEDTEPEIPENVDPESVLTRAELTKKIAELEDLLSATKIMLGVEE